MRTRLGRFYFEGPFDYTAYGLKYIEKRAGVYAVFCGNGEERKVLDLGEAEDLHLRLESHDRTACWLARCDGRLSVGACYTEGLRRDGRREMVLELRGALHPPCGGEEFQ
jgi:hypothetical protein